LIPLRGGHFQAHLLEAIGVDGSSSHASLTRGGFDEERQGAKLRITQVAGGIGANRREHKHHHQKDAEPSAEDIPSVKWVYGSELDHTVHFLPIRPVRKERTQATVFKPLKPRREIHSKTHRDHRCRPEVRQVVECASPLALWEEGEGSAVNEILVTAF